MNAANSKLSGAEFFRKYADIVAESEVSPKSMPRKLYKSEIRKYFSGDDYHTLADLDGNSKPATVESNDGKFYVATYDSGKADGYGTNECIRLKAAKRN